MAASFGSVWRMVRLHVPDAPALLVRSWVQDAYNFLYDFRPWNFKLVPGQIVWQDARTIDVTVALGSTTVTSAALFVAGDAGRQFRVGTFPIYTVQSVDTTSQITLDQPFQGTAGGAVDGTILDAWTTLPETFSQFTACVDQVTQRWIPWWMTMEELDLLDPTRTSGGNPRVLTPIGQSLYPPTLGRALFAFWPIPSTAGSFQYYMTTRPAELADETIFSGVLAHRPDVLETGALAAAAKWPGTAQRPNPYFNLGLAAQLNAEYLQLVQQLDLRDDDLNPQSLNKIPWQRWTAWTWAYNTNYLQMTDATLGAYVGMDGWYPSSW